MSDFYVLEDAKPSGNCIQMDCGKPAVAVLQCRLKPISLEVCKEHGEYFLGASLTPDGNLSIKVVVDDV